MQLCDSRAVCQINFERVQIFNPSLAICMSLENCMHYMRIWDFKLIVTVQCLELVFY